MTLGLTWVIAGWVAAGSPGWVAGWVVGWVATGWSGIGAWRMTTRDA